MNRQDSMVKFGKTKETVHLQLPACFIIASKVSADLKVLRYFYTELYLLKLWGAIYQRDYYGRLQYVSWSKAGKHYLCDTTVQFLCESSSRLCGSLLNPSSHARAMRYHSCHDSILPSEARRPGLRQTNHPHSTTHSSQIVRNKFSFFAWRAWRALTWVEWTVYTTQCPF